MRPTEGINKSYIAIDLKSFYASVECVEKGLDPLTTNLVVADPGRTDKTICLAVSPALKAYGIPGRARLYEVIQKVNEINKLRERRWGQKLVSKSTNDLELKCNPSLALDYIVAVPRMAYYISYSTRIIDIYLKYVAEEDMHVYSIDEVFIDATPYLKTYNCSARELAVKIIHDVLKKTGITATAGIGTNMYLAKVAMDIVAKHTEPDENGVRIAELDEMSYRKQLWEHRPIRDFWRVGKGYAKRLEAIGLYTMGDVALCSEKDEDALYRMFGVNAELLIDHAWGWEPCEIRDIRNYRPRNNSFSSGQVLKEPYSFRRALVVAMEMADEMGLNLLRRGLVTNQVVLTAGYDVTNLKRGYDGEVKQDFYGRMVPKHAHGTYNLGEYTCSSHAIREAVRTLFNDKVDDELMIRRITIDVTNVKLESEARKELKQLGLFDGKKDEASVEKEKQTNKAILAIKKRYGKNAILKGINFEEGATGRERNAQIGGHRE
ncbi:DNA methylase [Candidatus Saccharibacteria bacterium]|nr:DNA methylase [Candidatus Saccharibacteria bacterium]